MHKMNPWRIVDILIATSLIFIFMGGYVIGTDMSGITDFETDTLTAGALDGAIPKAAIVIFTTSCPAGWTRITTYDSRLVLGGSTYGSTGGASTHSHTLSSHTHGVNTLAVDVGGSHTHPQPATISANSHTNTHTHTQPDVSVITVGNAAAQGSCAGTATTSAGYGIFATEPHTSARSGSNSGSKTHSHTISGNSDAGSGSLSSVTNLPSYVTMVLCSRN